MITEPGIYSIPEQDYHADPCPVPSFSCSIGKILLRQSPLHAWLAHPKLNTKKEPEAWHSAMAFGSACHKLMTGAGAPLHVVYAADWRSKDARQERDEALDNGATPILEDDLIRARELVAAGKAQLQQTPGCESAFVAGEPEQTIVAREGDTWLRCMVDWIEPRLQSGHIVIDDYKTTGKSAAPHAISRHLFDLDYHMQAAFYERLLHHVHGDAAGKVIFRFIVQETDPPYELTVVELDKAGQEIGHKKIAAALSLWRRCMQAGQWPGYPRRIIEAEMPGWCEAQWLDREVQMAESGLLAPDPYLTGSDWMNKDPRHPIVADFS